MAEDYIARAMAMDAASGGGSVPDMSNYYTKTQTDTRITEKVAEIVADAPEDFDTLKEISDWIENHEESAAAMNSAIQANTAAISGKVDKVSGKGLSTNDFTTSEKTKLAGLENYDDSSVKADISLLTQQVSALQNDFRFAYGLMNDTDDFNDYTTSGMYVNNGTNSGQVNYPLENTNGLLMVIKRDNNSIIQIFFSTYKPNIYVRMKSRGTWGEWKQSALYAN